MTDTPSTPTRQTEEEKAQQPSPQSDGHGTATHPADHLDRDRESTEIIPRKSSLT